MTANPTDFPCDPLGGGCKALEAAKGTLMNDKANKKWVDEQMEKLDQKLDRMITWLVATCVSVLVSIVLMLGRFILSLLEKS